MRLYPPRGRIERFVVWQLLASPVVEPSVGLVTLVRWHFRAGRGKLKWEENGRRLLMLPAIYDRERDKKSIGREQGYNGFVRPSAGCLSESPSTFVGGLIGRKLTELSAGGADRCCAQWTRTSKIMPKASCPP